MQEEVGVLGSIFNWLNEHAAWFVPLAGAVVALVYRIHRYFTGLNRVADAVDKLTDEERGVMMKRDVLATIQPVLDHIQISNDRLKSTDDRLNRIEDHLMNRSKNQRSDD